MCFQDVVLISLEEDGQCEEFVQFEGADVELHHKKHLKVGLSERVPHNDIHRVLLQWLDVVDG